MGRRKSEAPNPEGASGDPEYSVLFAKMLSERTQEYREKFQQLNSSQIRSTALKEIGKMEARAEALSRMLENGNVDHEAVIAIIAETLALTEATIEALNSRAQSFRRFRGGGR